jgi:hypothetical protein
MPCVYFGTAEEKVHTSYAIRNHPFVTIVIPIFDAIGHEAGISWVELRVAA